MKPSVKNYFAITKTEWNGLVILILLIVVVLAIPPAYKHFHKDKPLNFKKFNQAVAQLERAGAAGDAYNADHTGTGTTNVHLFAFNPNKLSIAQWEKLGLSMRQIKGIKNYEAKGGNFYTKADVKKMYTLSADDYKRLEPYILLPAKDGNGKSSAPGIIVELNTADSATLTQLKGIGPGFARRIVQYRNRLGGFHNKQQLKEIFGMDDMHYHDIQAQFKLDNRKVQRKDVNKVELEDLKDFPYLTYKQANAIVQYRKQHGDYESFDELHNIAILDGEVLRKIKPYILIR
ncbi:helix-hairpin-helix domain-containing protein [Mucilaginibacter sp. PAMB04274]|uniref:helix-hairpin-helix domain-containing protein n=1 Tax=Mucilaginibacter sp. PAMB04274 TaxID=3138568 RepID=UPI0031F69CF4